MKLYIISDYGKQIRTISDKAMDENINETMHSLDWQGFHQVILEQSKGNSLEVGGSLDASDGFSVMLEENNKQYVIKTPPQTIEEMIVFLSDYLSDPMNWKNTIEWY
ncbi:MAG: hypothetical protein GQ569_09555 [Methylococcaceae bacterium]|nr:hypothetical protein [Methylococcaceae bacterium]